MRRIAVHAALAASLLGTVMAHATATDDLAPPRLVMTGYFSRAPIDLDHGVPSVQVMVNGHGPFRFIIQTGTPHTVISSALAESLALPLADGPGDPAVPSARIDSITFAAVRLEGVNALVGGPLLKTSFAADGWLGLSAFEGALMTIEYPRKQLVLVRDSLPPADGMDVLTMRRAGSSWSVPLRIANRTFDAIIDTHSMDGLDFALADTARLRWSAPRRVEGRAGGPGGPETTIFGGTLADDVLLGRHVIQSPFVQVGAPEVDPHYPILGSQVLQNFIFTLDQAHGRARFMRSESDPIVIPDPRGAPPGSTGSTTAGKRGK